MCRWGQVLISRVCSLPVNGDNKVCSLVAIEYSLCVNSDSPTRFDPQLLIHPDLSSPNFFILSIGLYPHSIPMSSHHSNIHSPLIAGVSEERIGPDIRPLPHPSQIPAPPTPSSRLPPRHMASAASHCVRAIYGTGQAEHEWTRPPRLGGCCAKGFPDKQPITASLPYDSDTGLRGGWVGRLEMLDSLGFARGSNG